MKIVRTVAELQDLSARARAQGKTVGLVPTMGALHHGHLTLIEQSKKQNDITVVSIFVNPTQFNNQADLATYPRTEQADVEKLEDKGVDYAFIPSVEEVYPQADNRVFDLGLVATVMEGAMRPGHFNGVAQIVSKLFDWVNPHRAYFGEKDFQQIAVIKRLVELGNYALTIVECQIDREDDGLARSSRNVRLTPTQRRIAPAIYNTLRESLEWKKQGLSPEQISRRVELTLNSLPEMKVEYYTISNSTSLTPITNWDDTLPGQYPVGCIAVYCGDVRLIDNIKYID